MTAPTDIGVFTPDDLLILARVGTWLRQASEINDDSDASDEEMITCIGDAGELMAEMLGLFTRLTNKVVELHVDQVVPDEEEVPADPTIPGIPFGGSLGYTCDNRNLTVFHRQGSRNSSEVHARVGLIDEGAILGDPILVIWDNDGEVVFKVPLRGMNWDTITLEDIVILARAHTPKG